VGRRRFFAASQETIVTQLTRELSEALDQQAATSEVLRIISSSPTDAQPVFDTIARSAARLCKAQFCYVFRFDGKLIHFAAQHGLAPKGVEAIRRVYPIVPGRVSAAARSILSGTVEEIPDIHADRDYEHGHTAKIMAYRSIVAVPMLKDGRPIGAIAMARSQTGHFPERHIDLLRTFAAQAVIAIENTRLLNELRDSLERQTATSEVLSVISSSPGELQPVFNAMLENATRICEASFGNLLLREGDTFRRVATHNAPPNFAAFIAKEPLIHRRQSRSVNRLIETKQADHIADMAVDEPETPIVKFGSARTLVTVPMLKENELIGAFGIYRQEVLHQVAPQPRTIIAAYSQTAMRSFLD
jgi:two-component system, NtrC family, sensor kinase